MKKDNKTVCNPQQQQLLSNTNTNRFDGVFLNVEEELFQED